MPGLSDHDIIFMELAIQAAKRKTIRREIFLWKKADLDGVRSDAKQWADHFVLKYDVSTPVQILFAETQQTLDKIVRDHMFNQRFLHQDITSAGLIQTPNACVVRKTGPTGMLSTSQASLPAVPKRRLRPGVAITP